MLHSVFLKTLRDQSRTLFWWGIGLVAAALYLVILYPSIGGTTDINKMLQEMPPALVKSFVGEFTDFSSPAGYLNGELFFFMVPLFFLIFTIGFGSGAIAGEEERGTLDFLLSLPVTRSRLVLEKFAAMVAGALVLAFTLWLGLAIGVVATNVDVSLARLAEAALSATLLGLAFGAFALALGCASGNRGSSIGVASGVGAAAYLIYSLASIVDAVEPYRKLSPFYYNMGANPLVNGLNPGHAAVLIGLTVVFLAVAISIFERRDLAA